MKKQPFWQGTLWQEAARAGLNTLISCLLLSAITVLPYLAQSHDFAHRHPEGTAPHMHELDALLVVATVEPAVVVRLVPFERVDAMLWLESALSKSTRAQKQSRAPPVIS